MRLLMITGDRSLAQGKKGPFHYMLEEFSQYWERIDIICPRIQNSKFKIQNLFDNVYVHSSNMPLILHPFFILKEGKKAHKKHKFDLFTIHSYPPFYNDIGGLWLHKTTKIPYISEIMHITGYPKSGNFKEWFYGIATGALIKYFTKNSKAIRIINQNQTREFLRKSGIAENKLKYIPAFYIDLDVFKPIIAEKKYDVVFSGRLVKNKGIVLLLKAIKQLKNWKPNIILAITGSGPLENKIRSFIKNNKLQNNINFIGWVQGTEELAKIYNQSKIMVMPSFNEGGPRVTLEAMACNVPVLTSRVGIMNDIIIDMENGIFIDWNVEDIIDKITLLLKDNNLRNQIAENGRKTVQQFERKKAIQQYAEAYQKLLNDRNV